MREKTLAFAFGGAGFSFESTRIQPAYVVVTTGILLICLIKWTRRNDTLSQFYHSQPCPARKNELFPWLRATLRSFTDTPQRVAEGYTKYSKNNIPFLSPNIRQGPVLIIPPSELKSLLSNPENKLAAHIPQFESVSAAYTMRDPAIYPSNYEVDIVKKQITRKYASVAEALAEEIGAAFDEYWGMESGKWKDVLAWGSLQEVAARAFNRVVGGLELCQNETFLKRSIDYSMSIQRDGPAIALLPGFLKPVLGPLITWKGKRDCEACIQMLVPIVEQRLEEYSRNKDDPAWTPTNDILHWLILESFATNNVSQITPRRIAHRIVILNFNSVPPTGLTLANLLLDLYSSPESAHFVAKLREECDSVLAATPEGYWTKDAVEKLRLVDSTIRESMRHSDFGTFAFPRRVAAPSGIKNSTGLQIPYGTNLAVPMHSIHMDSDFYPNASHFNPFRFAPHDGTDGKPLVTLDDTFLTFGYGRHGCPGRFFGAHLMKTMMAYVVQKYDVEEMKERPRIVELMEFRFPSEGTRVRVRRREGR